MEGSIRVWLEPSYDHGRTGAWMLDWPGAFTWGSTRTAALARVPSAVSGFVEWLADHGDAQAAPVPLEAEVVDEVAAFRLDDGYEVNATFAADERPVDTDELELQVRRLEFARHDLLELLPRLQAFLDEGGRLAPETRSQEAQASGASQGREVEQVVRHLAGGEAWFASRLDPEARYPGSRDAALDDYLSGTRQFMVERLRLLQATQPLAVRTDGKGENWTLAKLLRRVLYHSLDHLHELDRRLAVAERQVDRLTLRSDAELDVGELQRLFASVGLARRARDSAELTQRVLAGSTQTVSAWDGSRLVGFARIISDEATNGYISTVAVAPRWQDRGLGTRLMRALMDGREELKLTLDARDGADTFYERLGFHRVDTVYVRPRDDR